MINTIQIFHGYDAQGRMPIEILEATTKYTYMYTYISEVPVNLDGIYRENQCVHGDEINVLHEARSLVVGDLISVTSIDTAETGMYVVDVFGFKKLTAEEWADAARKVRS